jgi:cytochrome c-type biogenesis protein CcmH
VDPETSRLLRLLPLLPSVCPAVHHLQRAAGRWALLAALALSGPVLAREAPPATADPVLEAQVMRISSELRCLVCQNETIAASHADLAVDLRNQVRDMLRKGSSEREIYDYMTARYGDFVLYRPPVKSSTLLLWYAPPLMLVGGLLALWLVLRRRNRLSEDRFEPEET